jgi:hypothetical protein
MTTDDDIQRPAGGRPFTGGAESPSFRVLKHASRLCTTEQIGKLRKKTKGFRAFENAGGARSTAP